jgi:hypothetical protein
VVSTGEPVAGPATANGDVEPVVGTVDATPGPDHITIRIGGTNNGWTIVVYPDGRFHTEETWSDGETSFRNDCGGSRPTDAVDAWFVRARDSATQEAAPDFAWPAPGEYRYSLAYHRVDGTVRYVPADVHADVLATWAAQMRFC